MSMFNFNRLRKSLRPSTTPGPSPPHSPASFYSPGHTSPTFKESDFPAGYSALQSSNFFPSPRHTQDSPYYPTVTPGPAPHKRSPSQPFARVPATSPELVLDIPDGSFTDNFSQDMLHSRNPHRADKRNSNRRSIQKSDRTRRAPATVSPHPPKSALINLLQILPSVIEDIVPVVKYRSTSNPSSSVRLSFQVSCWCWRD
ncbi:hypothetical protein SISSUDRAFT_694710 [Sistotremastrum suecicum HHB10207 ss-3]|uniref:Uncharacterized protein n=1 Tax=Sistotremastrum suecicum HHB10207 ss-3 TaxID=1314776 RepID=A0A166I642_9AGAM|nr:hypothetical protein SISSUDRAFT_694710 [Sistotremastrum suecicum HHB10207 ss-3]